MIHTRGTLFLLFVLLGCTGTSLESNVLDDILSARTDREFNNALREHGPVLDEEIPALADATEAWNVRKRRNAVRLLTLAATPEADAILRQRVEATNDAAEWAYAVRGLLEGPGAAEVAALRPDLAAKARESDDPTVRGIGVRAGVLAGDPSALADLASELEDPSWEVRGAAVEAIAASGSDAFESELRDLLERETDPRVMPWLLETLARSTRPETAALLRERFVATDPKDTQPWLAAFSNSEAPWVEELMRDLASQEGPHRTDALNHLVRRAEGQVDLQLFAICAAIYDETPERGEPDWHRYQTWRQRCQGMVNDVEGRIVPPEEVAGVLHARLDESGD